MSPRPPRLYVPAGALRAVRNALESLRSAFEVVEVESLEEARSRAGGDLVLWPQAQADERQPPAPTALGSALEHIGEGVGVVDAAGRLHWANTRLRQHAEAVQRCFVETCREAMEQFDQGGASSVPLSARPGRRYSFARDEAHFEVLVSIASVDDGPERRVKTVVGILSEVTEHRRLQARIDAVDAAGAELMRIDATTITRLNVAERLALLEEKMKAFVRDLLSFDNFEVRLVDRETNRLELVFNHGLTPLRIGEVLHAEEEGNGISGYVAATGRPYISTDAARDPRYRPGLEDARSSLTVPLQLFDRVLGVFNIESTGKEAFDDDDRRLAQIFARYLAMAMHILDLLVVERYTTNEQISETVLNELNEPIDEITREAATLRDRLDRDGGAGRLWTASDAESLERILHAANGIRRRLAVCRAGPKSLLGAEQEMNRESSDPSLVGKRVILADNEATVREAISELLRRKGCEVTVCSGGTETIELLRASRSQQVSYDLVISDVRMPDHNGYDVFRTARECSADTPVILITGFGYDPDHSIVRASQEGLDGFLFKPLQARQLLDAVTKAFEPR